MWSSGIVFHNSQLSRRIGFPSASKCLPLVPSRPADVVSHLSRLAFVLQMWCPHCIRIAVRLPPTTSNGLPGAAHSHVPIASHLLPGCLRDMVLQMPLYWFPWPLHVSPCALCCPARRMSLFTCLPSCVSWCAYTSVRLLTCPLYFQRQKAVGFQFPEAGGASPLLLPSAYVRRVPGSLELCPPCVSQRIPRFVFHLVSRFVDCPVLHCVSHFVPDIVPHFVSQHVSDCASNFARRCVFQCVLHCASPPACPGNLFPLSFPLCPPPSSIFVPISRPTCVQMGFPRCCFPAVSRMMCGSCLSPLSSTCRPAFSNDCRPETQMWFPT